MGVPGEDGVLGVAGEFLDDGERDVLRDQVGDVAVPELVEMVRGAGYLRRGELSDDGGGSAELLPGRPPVHPAGRGIDLRCIHPAQAEGYPVPQSAVGGPGKHHLSLDKHMAREKPDGEPGPVFFPAGKRGSVSTDGGASEAAGLGCADAEGNAVEGGFPGGVFLWGSQPERSRGE